MGGGGYIGVKNTAFLRKLNDIKMGADRLDSGSGSGARWGLQGQWRRRQWIAVAVAAATLMIGREWVKVKKDELLEEELKIKEWLD